MVISGWQAMQQELGFHYLSGARRRFPAAQVTAARC
jgi:hypothetical protein